MAGWWNVLQRCRSAPVRSLATLTLVVSATTVSAPVATAQVPRVHVVRSVGDAEDARPGDGSCAAGHGHCTLRAAITEANASAGADRIHFRVPGDGRHTIRPRSPFRPLSDLSGPTTIDGFTQPGSQRWFGNDYLSPILKIEVAGPGASVRSTFDGLRIRSGSNVVRGLALYAFRAQVLIEGPAATDNHVLGNHLGLDAAWNGSEQANQHRETVTTPGAGGVIIRAGATGNVIGRRGQGEGNLVSGNGHHGVSIHGEGTDGNVVRSNTIGLAWRGEGRRANQGHGVVIASGASDNIVGGPGRDDGEDLREGNTISGNRRSGVFVAHGPGTTGNQVVHNVIGGSPTTRPGSGTRNGAWGVHLQNDVTANTVADNVIVNSGEGGVLLGGGVSANRVTGNDIGVYGFESELYGQPVGVRLAGSAADNVVATNVVAGSGGAGIENDESSHGNTFSRNSIDANGGLGIDLAPVGAENPPLTEPGGAGANDGVGAPVLDAPAVRTVTGRSCTGCLVELFATDTVAGVPGQGRTGLGSATVVGGRFSIALPAGPAVVVTATATAPSGSTSEFSRGVAVPEL